MSGDASDHFDQFNEPNPPCCKSCGVPYVSHEGLQGTCAMLQESLTVIELLLGASDSGRRDDARRRKIAVTFLHKAKGVVK